MVEHFCFRFSDRGRCRFSVVTHTREIGSPGRCLREVSHAHNIVAISLNTHCVEAMVLNNQSALIQSCVAERKMRRMVVLKRVRLCARIKLLIGTVRSYDATFHNKKSRFVRRSN
jgi:hypothetical protein